MNCLQCDKEHTEFTDFYLMERMNGTWMPAIEEFRGVKGFVMITKEPSDESVGAEHIQDANGFDREWACPGCFKSMQKKFLSK